MALTDAVAEVSPPRPQAGHFRACLLLALFLAAPAAFGQYGINLVANGDFEGGAASWTQSSAGGYPTITNNALSHAGHWVAFLGGYDNAVDTLYQAVAIPGDPGKVSLQFWYHIESQEGGTSNPYDKMTVSVANAGSGATLAVLATLSNMDYAAGWAQTPAYDVTAYKGQTIRLVFNATTDSGLITSFFIDDITMLAAPPVTARLTNISTRAQVLTGNDVMIAGFIIGGSTAKTVVVSVAGPSLSNFGITNPLANPTLTLVRSSDQSVLGTNDNWQAQGKPADAAAIQASGFQPSNALEPAIIATLDPGAYTAIVQGVSGGTGVGLVGVFEVDHPETPLINISTRAKVLTGNDVMIAGFIVQGVGTQRVVINVAGPSLNAFGLNGLQNPTLTLVRSSDNAVLATNDNWQLQTNFSDFTAIKATGFQPNNDLEPAIIVTLPAGAYTAIVSGVATFSSSVVGAGLVGVFAAP
jgi:hypothetical protein